MSRRTLSVASFLFAAVLGCSHHAAPRRTAAADGSTTTSHSPAPLPGRRADVAPAATADAGGTCPMDLPGAKVSITQVPDGVAMNFTTTGDVIALRQRVHELGRSADEDAAAPSAAVPVAGIEDLPNGVRVIYTPADPAQLDALKQTALRTSFLLNQGDCASLAANGMQLPAGGERKANRVPPRARRP
jgi:hypothetical protein